MESVWASDCQQSKMSLIYNIKVSLKSSSFRRMPESMAFRALDSGIRRNDGLLISLRFPGP